MQSLTQALQILQKKIAFVVSRRRGLILRSLLCWILGLVVFAIDVTGNYDQRLDLRGSQKSSDQIVLITLKQSEMTSTYVRKSQFNGDYEPLHDLTDSFFWNQKIWTQLLTKILKQNPKAIGVTLYFGNNIGDVHMPPDELKLYTDPRIFWSSTSNYLEQDLTPKFAKNKIENIATNEISKDEDGVVRRVFTNDSDQISEKLTNKKWPSLISGVLLNYRGAGNSFKQLSASEILFDEIPADFLSGKIILIGAETINGQTYMTPVGTQSRLEILAHTTDNLLENRSIKKLSFIWYALILLFFTALAVYLITNHPQKVVIMFFIWITTLAAALSVWSFDAFFLWIPALTPPILMMICWIIFVSYQANKIEQLHFQLQQEQKSLIELEQLKNNFVSLISHDLKTPIAKIQAVVDRLMLEHNNTDPLTKDLKALRTYSDELSKYIQSILKLLHLESRDFHLNLEPADINEIIEEVVMQISPLAVEMQVQVETQLEPLFSLEFDIILLKEVVLNLVENAIKYTPKGGLVLITSEEVNNVVKICIKDTGVGIKKEDLDKVWGKFTRGSDQDLKTKGTGLGLYLVKYFIELHHGSVQIESSLNLGTTVTFTLPIENEETLNIEAAKINPEKLV